MVLIADSGSTKTHWCILKDSVIQKHIYTKGINPFYQTESEIKFEIESQLISELEVSSINKIFFYGAGCSFPEKKVLVSNALGHYFKHTPIEVQSDLLGAARSLFGREKGIACILGTGSNSCYYNGNNIVENISPLGYILGDEGSGAVLSKTFVSDCLKNQISTDLKDKFFKQFNTSPAVIMENVYKKPFPNRYLATFTPFLSSNIQEPDIYKIVYNGFESFLQRNVMQYSTREMKIGVIGSVGFYFEDILRKVAAKNKLEIDIVTQNPIDGLVKYHTFK